MNIRILGISLDRFARLTPNPLSILPSSIAKPWKAAHEGLKNPMARTASLAGVWLLWKSGANATLGYTKNGKPTLAADSGAYAVSITHTARYAFCAVADCSDERTVSPIGLDAEERCGRGEARIKAIAERFFTEGERSYFASMPNEARFLEIWTMKEALVKCTGEGIRGLHAADTKQTEYSFAHFLQDGVTVTLAYPNGFLAPRAIEML